MLVPVFTWQNPLDAIGARGRVARKFGTEEAKLDSGCLWAFAAADIGVTVVQFTNQFADQIGEIVAVIHEWEERGVLVPLSLPIDAVHDGRIEEVAHLSPGLEVNLSPFGPSIEMHVETFEFEF